MPCRCLFVWHLFSENYFQKLSLGRSIFFKTPKKCFQFIFNPFCSLVLSLSYSLFVTLTFRVDVVLCCRVLIIYNNNNNNNNHLKLCGF